MENKTHELISSDVIQKAFYMDFVSEADTLEEYGEEILNILGDDIFKYLKDEHFSHSDLFNLIYEDPVADTI